MTKKLLTTLVALFAISVSMVSAQQKGDFYVGGNLGLSTSSAIIQGESVTATEFAIQPNVGYFVADNLMVGLGIGYSVTGGDGATHLLTVGPKLSYFVPVCDKLYYTPSLDILFCYAASDGYGVPGFGLGLNIVGFEYRPTKRIGLSASVLSFDYAMLSKEGITLNTIDFGLTLSPNIGLKFYF